MASAHYFIMEYMSGKPYNQAKDHYSAEEQEAIEHQFGRYNRESTRSKARSLDISPGKTDNMAHGEKPL